MTQICTKFVYSVRKKPEIHGNPCSLLRTPSRRVKQFCFVTKKDKYTSDFFTYTIICKCLINMLRGVSVMSPPKYLLCTCFILQHLAATFRTFLPCWLNTVTSWQIKSLKLAKLHILGTTVVPAFNRPSDEWTPAMAGHFRNVRTVLPC